MRQPTRGERFTIPLRCARVSGDIRYAEGVRALESKGAERLEARGDKKVHERMGMPAFDDKGTCQFFGLTTALSMIDLCGISLHDLPKQNRGDDMSNHRRSEGPPQTEGEPRAPDEFHVSPSPEGELSQGQDRAIGTSDKDYPATTREDESPSVSDSKFYYMGWTIIFGVFLGLGGSLLENVQVNPMAKLFLSGPFVIVVLTVNKIVIRRPLSVTGIYVVASSIAIFTNYLGPPHIGKLLFIFAGFSFDLFTFFKTENIRYWNLVLGHCAATLTGFSLAYLMTYLLSPALANGLIPAFLLATGIYFMMIFPLTWVVWKALPIDNPPDIVRQIRATMID